MWTRRHAVKKGGHGKRADVYVAYTNSHASGFLSRHLDWLI